METAKVDVRKLQMLNDRINQTIDALNQVRLSVHGMNSNGNGAFTNGTTPFAASPFTSTIGAPGAQLGATGGIPGIGWTHPAQVQAMQHLAQLQQIQQIQQLQQLQQMQQMQALQQLQHAAAYGSPFGVSGYGVPSTFGIGSTFGVPSTFGQTYGAPFGATTWGTSSYDPFTTGRVSQTFPFAQWGYSPVASASWQSASQMS